MAALPSTLKLHGMLLAAAAIGVGVGIAAPLPLSLFSRVAVGWETALAAYLAGALWRMARSEGVDDIRRRAAALDQAGAAILPLSVGAALASLVLVIGETSAGQGAPSVATALLTLGAVAVSWLFVHVIFALHYAHAYYAPAGTGAKAKDAGGLLFPGEGDPDYWDFLHFALIIGVASQTADIQITGRGIRRVSTVHSVTAFVFNTVLLALAVNLAVSLLGRGG